MKTTNILLSLSVIGTLTLGFAAPVATVAPATAVQTKAPATTTVTPVTKTVAASAVTTTAPVTKKQVATPTQRVQLMNQFKQKIANMSPEDRAEAMAKMQTQMQVQAGNMGEMDHQGMRENAQEHATQMQMEHGEEMNRAQNMNQQQAGSQFGHENEAKGGSFSRENIENTQSRVFEN